MRSRLLGVWLKCKQCGYICHADLNGAINIGKALSAFPV
ncbi:transposase [Hazenella sp. IB182357]|uniref:Transposase n=1 Tax=Polycladospora coralii TaxID=2771432 RepID=A0A926RSQ5_9BACL|nr:zinc ribbon domain-containing protein [Polycladospora coralii]MBD1371715.1 transposase [Polycladospora coralii]MBS7529182.1 transposase [Polycladospora coralii]